MTDPVRISRPPGVHASVGYSHAVVRDGWVFMSGQVPVAADGTVLASRDVAAQARQAFDNVMGVLAAVGAVPADVVKLTYYVTDIGDLPEVIAARDRHFSADEAPASTVVEVRALFHPNVHVEIEAVARVAATPTS